MEIVMLHLIQLGDPNFVTTVWRRNTYKFDGGLQMFGHIAYMNSPG